MRPQKVKDQEMLEGLLSVLRSKGFDGSSLNELAEASGLQKASLYYRFPQGKKEMANAVLNYLNTWIQENIIQVLTNESIDAKKRTKTSLKNISLLYKQGEAVCLFRSFLMGSGIELFGEQIKNAMQEWINAFTKLGVDLKFKKAIAKKMALQTLIDIQGSLVVSKGMGTTQIFKSTIKSIENKYLTN